MTAACVVTGLGVAAPNGVGTEEFWTASLTARRGIAPVERFDASSYPSSLAGEITDFDPAHLLTGRLLPQTDRMTRMALVAADWAVTDAGVEPGLLDEFDMGVITASSSGGFEFGHGELEKLAARGSEYVSAYQAFAWFYAVNTGQISIRHGMRGPSGVIVADQAGGLEALAQARRQIRRGTGLVVSGGIDGSLCPWGWVAHQASGRLTTSADPARAFLPFDEDADGHVPGEGGAILVVEDADSARARGNERVYGEIAGHASTFDPPPGSGRPPALERAIRLALDDAGVEAREVDVVFADAAGEPGPDAAEADALRSVFGPFGVPVAAPKALTGRLYSGGGPLDVVAALLTLRDGLLPPAPGIAVRAEYEIDLVVDAPRAVDAATALVLARGHHGFNSALVVRRPAPTRREAHR